MEQIFLRILDQKRKFIFVHYLILKRHFQNNCWVTRDVSFEFSFVRQLLRCQCAADMVRLVSMKIPMTDTSATPLTLNKFTVNFLNHLYFCTERLNPSLAIMMAEYYGIMWAKIADIRPDEVLEHSNLKFGDQVLMIQLMPIIHVIKGRTTNETEYLEKFINKLFCISCDFTMRHLYAIQEVLRQSGHCVLDLACKSIKGLIAKESMLTNERATLVFQSLVYLLNEYLPVIVETSSPLPALKKPQLLTNLLIGIHSLLKKYSITWRDCIETTTLTSLSLILLNNDQLSGPLAIHVLQLIKLSIESFLSPNMALLVDNLDGSGLENLAVAMKRKLRNDEWEIRDSAVQLIRSMVEISKEKYPTFQKLLIESEVIPDVVTMATEDNESYVRASAFQCITSLLWVKCYWKQLFSAGQVIVSIFMTYYYSSRNLKAGFTDGTYQRISGRVESTRLVLPRVRSSLVQLGLV